jgi:hypothetical protein
MGLETPVIQTINDEREKALFLPGNYDRKIKTQRIWRGFIQKVEHVD